MKLLDGTNFTENKNGRVSQVQYAELQKGANIWFDVLLFAGIIALVGFFSVIEPGLPRTIPALVGLGIFALWMVVRIPTLFKHYLVVMPDMRENRLAFATGKLAYHRKYILQTDEARLSLPGDKNEGLLAGNLYEVYYLPRAQMVISARMMQLVSEAQQGREFTSLFGKLLGFSETDIQSNRNGEFTFNQKMIIIKKSWWLFLTLLFSLGFVLWALGPALIPSTLAGDTTIIFWLLCPGVVTILVFVLILGGLKDGGNLLALFERTVEKKEGIACLSERTSGYGKSRTTHYYLGIDNFELQISQRAHEVLVDGLYYRVYYTPRLKYLASLEVLKTPGENSFNQ